MSKKYALIIGNTEYTDLGLAKLTAPGRDAEDFARVLSSSEIGAFDEVQTFNNENVFTLNEAIEGFFLGKKPEDLLIFYFSGHGVRDDVGLLFLAVKNTNRERLRSTSIKADFVREMMDQSRSNRQVIILDCCNSGAFARGTKASTGGSMGYANTFEGTGYGRVVLTATDSTQFAWEGDKIIGGEVTHSLFTHFLIEGLEGEADENNDGKITVDELYNYAHKQIVTRTPKQTPGIWSYKQQGKIILREGVRKDLTSLTLPELIKASKSIDRSLREEVVQRLEYLIQEKDVELASSAKKALITIANEDDSRRISQLATEVLEKEKARREAAEKAAKEKAEREAAEKAAKEKAEREEAEKIAREKHEREAIEKAVREAAEKAAKEKAEREAAEKAEREEAEKIAREKHEREAAEKTEREAAEKTAKEKSGREVAENERRERLHKEKELVGQRKRQVLEPKQVTGIAKPDIQKELVSQNLIIEAPKQKIAELKNQTLSIGRQTSINVKTGFGILGAIILIAASYFIFTTNKTIPQIAEDTTGDNGNSESSGSSSAGDNTLQGLEFSNPPPPLSVVNTPIPEVSDGIGAENADSVSQIARWGKGNINEAIFSPDGKMIVLSTSIGLYLLDTVTLGTIRFIDTGNYNLIGATFSEDQKNIIALSSLGDILIFDSESGTFINGYQGKFDFLNAYSFLPEKNTLALSGSSQQSGISNIIYLYDLTTGITEKLVTDLRWPSTQISKLKFSPDGNILGGSTRGGIIFWDEDGNTIGQYPHEENWSTDYLSFSPDGSMAAFVDSSNSKIIIADPSTGNILAEMEGHDSYPSALAFSPDGKRLYYTVGEGTIRVRDVSDQSLLYTYQENKVQIVNITFSPNGDVFLVSRYDGNYELWDTNTGKPTGMISDHLSRITSMALSPNNEFIVGIESQGHVFSIQSSVEAFTFEGTDFWASNCTFNPLDGNFLFEGNGFGLWKMRDGEMQLIKEPDFYVQDFMVVSPDGSFVVVDNSNEILIYNYDDILNTDYPQSKMSLSVPETIADRAGAITDLKISPDGNLIAASMMDGMVQIWNSNDGSIKFTLNGLTSRISGIAFSPDTNQISASSDDGLVITWNLENGDLMDSHEVPTGEDPEKLIYSPNGEIIAIATYNGKIVLMNTKDGAIIKTLEGHSDLITGLLFTSDSKILISSSYDGTIRLWGITQTQ